MSAVFVPFLYELRAKKVKVGPQEGVSLAKALVKGLHESSLDGFYHVARAICVHREADLDAFDEAYLSHFKGIASQSLELVAELDDWLKDPKLRKELSAEELAMLETLDMEELRRRFEERLKEQRKRHDGGNRWIGTGGTSPFGAHGQNPGGLRVGPAGGGKSAMGVADARRYRPYRSDLVLDVRQIEVALRKLRVFHREGQEDELDIDETVRETAKNAGELEIVLRPPRKSNTRVLLLMDVGGSMDPHADVVSRLFSASKRASNIRSLKTFYFHNCVYGRLYETERFTDPVPLKDVLEQCGPEWKLVLVGDAAMHPTELLGAGDWEYYARGGGEMMPGIRWLMRLADHFRRAAWLNPDPPAYWRGGTAEQIEKVFPMFQLTLDGLGEAISHLSRGDSKAR